MPSSKHGESAVETIAADANVLLSAVTGHGALKAFTRSNIQVITAESVIADVEEYIPKMAIQYNVDSTVLHDQLGRLRLSRFPSTVFGSSLEEAKRQIGDRDIDDVDLLALALHFRVPIWSNDNDFEVANVPWYTTAQPLKSLGI